MGFGAPVGERDTGRNNKNRRVERIATERGAGAGIPNRIEKGGAIIIL
jgi:hypothetical protein